MTPDNFVTHYGPLADDISQETGVHPDVALGIVAQETGWGDHVSGNNIFGISPIDQNGQQYVAGYPSVPHAAQAYVDLFKRHYELAKEGRSPQEQAQLVADLGYNRNPDYGPSVIQRMQKIREARERQQQKAPAFDPSKPFEEQGGAPPFDPNKPFQEMDTPPPSASAGSKAPPNLPMAKQDTPAQAPQTHKPFSLPPSPAAQPPTPTVDEYGRPIGQVSTTPSPALERIKEATKEGFTGAPSILPPAAQDWLEKHGLGRTTAIDLPFQILSAGMSGGATAAYEMVKGLGMPETLARDVAGYIEQGGPVTTGAPHVPLMEPLRLAQENRAMLPVGVAGPAPATMQGAVAETPRATPTEIAPARQQPIAPQTPAAPARTMEQEALDELPPEWTKPGLRERPQYGPEAPPEAPSKPQEAPSSQPIAAPTPEAIPTVEVKPTRIRTIEQIQTEDGVGAKKAAAIQMEEIAAVGRPITAEEAAARKAGVKPAEGRQLEEAGSNYRPSEEPPPRTTEEAEPQGQPEEPTGKQTPYGPVPHEPQRLIDFLRRPTVFNQGTIHETTLPGGLIDAGGDLKAILGGAKGRPGLINSKGRTLDDATLAAWENGYFPEHGDQRPEINHLLVAIRDDHAGIARYSDHDLDRVQEYKTALDQNAEIDRLADQHSIPTRGLTRDQFFDTLHDRLSQEDRAAEIASQDAAARQTERAARTADGDQAANEAEFYGQSQARTLRDLENEYKQERLAPEAVQHASPAAEAGGVGSGAGAGEEGVGSPERGTGPTGRGAAEGPNEGEALEPQFARKPPLPNEGGAPLFGEAPKEPAPKREAEPTIKGDKRQVDMFGTADAAVQAQAARDQAGRGALEPKAPQAKPDEGLFAPKAPEQDAMFGQTGWDTAGGPTDRMLEKPHPEAVKALTDAANKMLGGKGTIEIYDAGENGFTIRQRNGSTFQASGYALGRLIRIALGGDTEGFLNHEVLHALRNMGLFTEGEWNRLIRAAEQGGWADKTMIGNQPVREAYGHLPYEKMLEESIAERFRQFMQSGKTPPLPLMARVLSKIKAFVQRLRTGLAGEGFRTPEDVFSKIASGEVGQREIGSGMPTRQTMDLNSAKQMAVASHESTADLDAQFARRPQPNLPLPGQTSHDVLREKTGLRRWGAEIKAAFSPTSLRGAKPTERELRQHTGTSARDYDQAVYKLDQVRQAVDKLSQQDQIAFTHRIETLQPQPTPELQAAADALRSSLDDWATKIRGLGRGYLANAIDGYMGHIWGNYDEWVSGQQAGRTQGQMQQGATAGNVAKSPLRGPGHFLKQRSFPTQEEGIAQGLIPVTYNPIDLQLIKIHELQKFYNGTQLADRMKQNGIARFVRDADQRDAKARGWVKLNDRVFQPKLYGASPIGPVEPGAYYANEAGARIFNNYMSTGWRGESAIYDGISSMNNALNTVQLGIPGFHMTFVMMDTAMSKAALGMEQIMAGHPVRGGGNILFGNIPPAAVIATLRKGGQVRKAWLDPANSTPEYRQIADIIQSAGMRISMPTFFQTSASGSFFKSLRDLKNPGNIWNQSAQMFRDEPAMWRKAIAVPTRIAARLLDTINEPIMGAMVPRAKLGVMADWVQNYLRDNPNATPEQLRDATIKFNDSVDNRLGQMNYDNLHWNKVQKDIAFIAQRSVGWNLGTLREIGGGFVDTAAALNNVAHMRAPQFTSRMAYTMVLPVITAEIGAVMTYLATGKPPQHRDDDIRTPLGNIPLDYFYPPTGVDESGNATGRRSMPGYMKDVFAFRHDPLQTVLNKTAPFPEAILELGRNRNFYGGHTRDTLPQFGDFLLNQPMPFAFRAQAKLQAEGASWLDQSLAWFGFQPAPASITHPEKEAAFQRREDAKARKAETKAVAKGNYLQFFNRPSSGAGAQP